MFETKNKKKQNKKKKEFLKSFFHQLERDNTTEKWAKDYKKAVYRGGNKWTILKELFFVSNEGTAKFWKTLQGKEVLHSPGGATAWKRNSVVE